MDKEEFVRILSNTMQQRIILYCIVFVIAIILLVTGIRVLHADNQTKKKAASFFTCALFLVGYFCVFAFPDLIAIQKDIENTQIVSIEGCYNFDATSISKRSLFGKVYISTAKDSFALELPAQWTSNMFPRGKYYGTIHYGEESKIIVGFQTTSSEDGP